MHKQQREKKMYNDTSVVGKGLPLRGGYTKVVGMERFAPDRVLAGAFWMKILQSPHPHANIKSIDVTKTVDEVCHKFEERCDTGQRCCGH